MNTRDTSIETPATEPSLTLVERLDEHGRFIDRLRKRLARMRETQASVRPDVQRVGGGYVIRRLRAGR